MNATDTNHPQKAAAAPGFAAVDVLTPDVLTPDVVAPDAVLAGGGEAKLEIDVAGGIVIRLREDASVRTRAAVQPQLVVARWGRAEYPSHDSRVSGNRPHRYAEGV